MVKLSLLATLAAATMATAAPAVKRNNGGDPKQNEHPKQQGQMKGQDGMMKGKDGMMGQNGMNGGMNGGMAPAGGQTTAAAQGQPDIDVIILNYALTLEHLENAFYRDALPSEQEFRDAGYQDFIRQRFIEIGGHEQTHVDFLSGALGDQAVQECTYNFGVNGPASFIAVSQLLEGVGVSAYLGAAQNITSISNLNAAGSILSTEARHSGWVQSSAALSDAFGNPYDTPLNYNQTFSLASSVIVSCPESNPPLPVMAFPTASFEEAPTMLGQTVTIVSDSLGDNQKVGFIGAIGAVSFAEIMDGNQVTLPEEVFFGRTYAIIVPEDAETITDDNTIAGPIAFDILPTAEEAAAFYSSPSAFR